MRIAIVGGIGSGKSEALKVAKSMGVVCESADEINARLLSTPNYVQKIAATFPSTVQDGIVNKKTLADIVFNDDSQRQKLNEIAHPQIVACICQNQSNPYVVEMPLIFESGCADFFDEIILVHTPILLRLHRLRTRGLSFGQSVKRIQAQVSERKLKTIATCVVNNGGSLKTFRSKCEKIFSSLIEKDK